MGFNDMYGLKMAEDLDSNEDEMPPVTIELRPDAEGAEDIRGLHTPFSSSSVDGAKETVRGLLTRALQRKAESDKVEQRLMAENFAHVASGDFATRSDHLQPKAKEASYRPRTLADRVRGLCPER